MDMSTPYSPKPLVNATCKLGKKGCFEDGRCHALGDCENKIVTNADRIRAMTDEELAEFIPNWSYTRACKCDEEPFVHCNYECEKCVAEWLKQPAEVSE